MRLVRKGDGAVVADDLRVADTFFSRLRGLMGRASIAPGEGLWIDRCDSIHMMFVRFRIDALFLRATGEVLKIVSDLRPWLGLAWCPGAACTVELAAGRAALLNLQPGDTLVVEEGEEV
jgi:uncharacterized membrane protein (UPF0127 family)